MKRLGVTVAVLAAVACEGDLSPRIELFSASRSAIAAGESTELVFSVPSADSLSIDQGIGDVTGKAWVSVTPTATTAYTLTASRFALGRTHRSTSTVRVTVGHAAPSKITVEGLPAEVAIETPVSLTLTVRDSFGNPVTDYAGTLRLASTDSAAPAVADVVFTAAMRGTATIPVVFVTDGNQFLVVTDTANPGLTGSAAAHANHGTAVSYLLSALPASAVAGTPLALTIKAVDRRGNLVTNYAGTAHVSSTDATDLLPADGGFTGGIRTVSLAFATARAHNATVTEAGGTITASTTSVNVKNAAAARVDLQGLPASVTVDASSVVTATVRDAFGNPAIDYTGTLGFTLSDVAAPAIPNVSFTPAMLGVATVPVVFFTAGDFSLTATDTVAASVSGAATTHVNHGAASGYALSALPPTSVAGVAMPLTIRAVDSHGNLVTNYAGTAHVSSTDATDLLPADGGFTGGVRLVSLAFVTAAVHSATVTEAGGTIAADTTAVDVRHARASRVTLQGLPAQLAADVPATVTVTVRDAFGNPVIDHAGTLHFVLTDVAAPPLADVTFTPAMSGTKDVSVLFFTAGDQSILVNDTASAAVGGSAATRVNHAGTFAYSLSQLPAGAMAGEPLPLTIQAVDRHGNLVTDYAGAARVSSTDATDRLPADGGFSGGVRIVSLAFVTAATHGATVSEVGGTITANTTSVGVVSADAAELLLSGAALSAGVASSTSVTARDTYGNTVRSYVGTVSFTSTDSLATLPALYTFTAVDAGQHAFPLTLRTAGTQNVTVVDVTHGLSTAAAFAVSPASGAVCILTDVQASAVPGALVGVKVTVKDTFANIATGYAGTVALSSSDAAARFSPPAAFTALDAGSRAFSARLNTTGLQTITATDSLNAFSCQGSVNVVAGPSFAVSFAGPEAWAGTPVTATITALDNSGNLVPTYAGTIAFTSSDPAAVKPANVTLTGTEGGTVNVNVTFNTIGLQTFTATDTVTAATTGTGTQTVHGLVYTNPPAGGKVRLVANASSNASLVRLDLVSNATLATVRNTAVETQPGCAANACSRRNGAFGAGMNLPVDINKVGPDTTLISTTPPAGSTAVLTLGPAPQAVGALLNTTNGVLYSAISQKRTEVSATTTTLRGDASVSPFPGASSFYYSLRLRLVPGAAVGIVFDGANLGSKFRAAIRDRSGSDVFSNPDFALGKLEVR